MATKKQPRYVQLINDLDCELQMLGARGDYGYVTEEHPAMLAETLEVALSYISKKQPKILAHAARVLLDMYLNRINPHTRPAIYSLAAFTEANEFNKKLFETLTNEYSSNRQCPKEKSA